VAEASPTRAFRIEPYAYAEARELADALGVSDPVAVALVRRGYRSLEAAREFLEADQRHDPFEFDAMEQCVGRILAAVHAGERITVHGDYDVDGVSSTAILVGALRELGASCDWLIPDRVADGYGFSEATVGKLAERGTRLVVTTDCGITSRAEVASAREAGVDVIVTDHHAPAEELPDCPILHPRLSGYPCPDLCATGVAYKLAAALRRRAGARDEVDDERDLDLVALATVADLVPLTGENRALVRAGLAEARRARRPGLRALMAVARIEPSRLDEGDLAFRLGPRINAAGRLYRADAGVELMLCADPERAAEIAAELDRANYERRDAELEVLAAAEAALRELAPEDREAPALVLAGEGWHPGVVGIVASRLAERHWRPVILVSLDGEGRGRGSGRSIPAFDLLAALRDCADHLVRFGGHRAAAGLEIEAGRLDEFRRSFVARAREKLEPDDLVRTETVDAVVGGDRLGLRVAEELERLGPFGMGNPGIRLLVPAARVEDVRPMGDEGKHARFAIASGAARALGVAFGSGTSLGHGDGDPVDASVSLELNQWNGTVEPRVVLRDLYPIPGTPGGANADRMASVPGPVEAAPGWRGVGCAGCPRALPGPEWWDRVRGELAAPPESPAGLAAPSPAGPRERVDHPPGSAIATLAELVSSGEPVLGVCADVSRRRELAERVDPSRFGGGELAIACGRCPSDPGARVRAVLGGGGLALADWGALARDPSLGRGFPHVVLIDPSPSADLEAVATAGEGYVHVAWEAEVGFSLRVHESEWRLGGPLRLAFRSLRDAGGELRGERLAEALTGEGPHPRTAEQAGRCVRVLGELELAAWDDCGGEPALRVVSSERTELERSGSYLAYAARHEEGRRFLSRQRRTP
jgi:single-stranded-DNA-specific exonuclease